MQYLSKCTLLLTTSANGSASATNVILEHQTAERHITEQRVQVVFNQRLITGHGPKLLDITEIKGRAFGLSSGT